MSHVNAVFDISHSFSDEIFLLRPLIESSVPSFLSTLSLNVFADLTYLFLS